MEGADGVFVVASDTAAEVFTARSLFWEGAFDLRAKTVNAKLQRTDAQCVEALLKTVVQVFTLFLGVGTVIHASSVERDGNCALFTGRSGVGKSTAAVLLEEAGRCRVLTDDVTFVSFTEGESPSVVTLPFRQRFAQLSRRACARVTVIYELTQGDRHAVVELNGPARVAALAKSIAVGARTPMLAARGLEVAERLAALVPVRRLYFSRDAGFWDIVEPALRGKGARSPEA